MADVANRPHSKFVFNMDCKIFFALVLICTMVAQCSSSIPYRHKRGRFCGSRLVEVMSVICNKRYNSPNIKRTGNFNKEYLDEPSLPEFSDDYSQNALMPPSSFFDLFFDIDGPFIPQRQQRGIIEECCKNPCTKEVLMSYCG